MLRELEGLGASAIYPLKRFVSWDDSTLSALRLMWQSKKGGNILVPYITFISENWWHLQCQDKILTLVPSRPFQSLSHSLVRKASARKIVKWVGASLKRKRVRSSLKKSVHKQRVRLSEGKSNSFTRLKPIRHEARGSRQRVLLTESAPRAREIGSG